jgi:hypothetical protein
MSLAQARLGSTIGTTVQVLPPGLGGQGGTDPWAALPAPGRSPASGPLPALGPAPAYAGSSYDDYRDLGFMPLGAPPYGDDGPAGMQARPYVSADQSPGGPARQPLYEPGYDGPPRFAGAPRGHGDIPQDELSSYPYGPRGRGAQPASLYPEDYPDRPGSGPRPARPGMAEPARPRAALPAPPRPGDRNSGPVPQLRTGSMAQPGTGPMPRPETGPLPRVGQGPPRNGMGPGTGPMPRAGTGPMPRADSGPMPRPGPGPMPGPMPPAGTGPMPRPGTGPMPRPDPMPRPGQPLPAGDPATGSRTGPPPRGARRGSHRARPNGPRYMAGPTGGDEWQ